MLERFHKLQPRPKTPFELKAAMPQWDDMPLRPINNAVNDYTKHLKACVRANEDTLNT